MEKNGYGELLKKARESKGLKHADVYKTLKIDPSYLAAMEDENAATLEKPIYMRLFLKTYSKYLKLDYKEIVGRYNDSVQFVEPKKDFRKETLSDKKNKEAKLMEAEAKKELASIKAPFELDLQNNKNLIIFLSSIAAVLLLIIVLIVVVVTKGPGSGKGLYVVPTPVAMQVTAKAKEDVWVKVKSDDKEEEISLKTGQQREWKQVEKMVFLVGNAGGVEFIVNGDNIGTIGDEGEVINGLVFEAGKNWYIDKKQGFKSIKTIPSGAVSEPAASAVTTTVTAQ